MNRLALKLLFSLALLKLVWEVFQIIAGPLIPLPANIDKETRVHRNVGLITIATNGYNASYLVKTARSRRNGGDFSGPFFLISDGDVSKTLESQVSLIEIPSPQDSLSAVALKPLVFRLVDQLLNELNANKNTTQTLSLNQVDQLFFLDADMRVNTPINALLDKVGEWDPRCSVYLPRERW